MKSIITVMLLAVAQVAVVAAQEVPSENASAEATYTENTKHFSVSGVWRADSVRSGGSAEVGFTLAENKWCVRDYVTFNGYGGMCGNGNESGSDVTGAISFGELSIGNKLQIGGVVRNGDFTVVPYGFMNGEFGLVRTGNASFFEAPFLLDIGGGGGFEFRFTPAMAFFIEYGGGFFFPVGNSAEKQMVSSGYELLSIGYRSYF
jgi:hypothetical protein